MSEVITGKKKALVHALELLGHLESGGKVIGILSFKRQGYGKVVGRWKDSWEKPITFRLKRTPSNDILEYQTDTTGWSNTKYGSPYDLLIGSSFQKGATKHRVINMLKQKESDNAE